MRAPTGAARLIAQMGNNQTKELPLRGSWHGMAVTEGVRERREIKKGRQSDETEIDRPSIKGESLILIRS